MARELGAVKPSDDLHVRKYGLELDFFPDRPTSMAGASYWYTNFDDPVWDAQRHIWRIGSGPLGSIRGGHCYCLPKRNHEDTIRWWQMYDQGVEGACVGFGVSRALSVENRAFLDAFWLYREAKLVDEWAGENYDGTSLRAGLDVVRTRGHRRIRGAVTGPVDPDLGIVRNRWARTGEEIARCLGEEDRIRRFHAFPILNSWGANGRRVGRDWVGRGYPHIVWLDADTLVDVLLPDWGEYAVFVDR
jgi:hypothetical protein